MWNCVEGVFVLSSCGKIIWYSGSIGVCDG